MRKLVLLILLAALPVCGQQLNSAQKLYEEALAAIERQGVLPAEREKLAPVMERLRTPRGWNNSADVYELLQAVRAHEVIADTLLAPSGSDELHSVASRLDTQFRTLVRGVETRVRNPDRDNLKRYAEANKTPSPPAAGEQRVVFLGDSITDAWKLAEYFPGKPYVNRGISGQITGEMLGRMKADVLNLKPAAIVVLAGTNDLARLVTVETAENNLSMIGDLARANGIKVIFASVLPVSDYAKDRAPQTPQRPPEKILQINGWLQQECKAKGYTYLDYFPALADEKGLLKADLANDGLHPNPAGYKIMAPLAEEAIERALAPAKGKDKRPQRHRGTE